MTILYLITKLLPSQQLQDLNVNGVPLYCTITARNSQGLAANATCTLAMYDTTPPDARVAADFYSTSDSTQLKGSALVIDESATESTEVSTMDIRIEKMGQRQ